ncbi:hypothetical protein FOXG_17712 [Fusarium oxysporum f. sp. lycopersici 4287]|uniref:Uncharacterized protein n=1 Tax=Fusarium oxysporum f. sp. lycopersici (strain 4287 / CBS 123668 / FGSC 9935 / NRRL 34936) TaxID=426428 RepID=A0A0J9WDM7_FUSO4|nr:uncharacterized protein FOXG_17712 [Fusarium oxysporum f. sp. lycopersici 4287]KNB20800.1 hypothetical protein FOXG_17712 [Fusarium oxysporum f. sp. lycopersici 4287]
MWMIYPISIIRASHPKRCIRIIVVRLYTLPKLTSTFRCCPSVTPSPLLPARDDHELCQEAYSRIISPTIYVTLSWLCSVSCILSTPVLATTSFAASREANASA